MPTTVLLFIPSERHKPRRSRRVVAWLVATLLVLTLVSCISPPRRCVAENRCMPVGGLPP